MPESCVQSCEGHVFSFQGMPPDWLMLLERSGISAGEQKRNPEVRLIDHNAYIHAPLIQTGSDESLSLYVHMYVFNDELLNSFQ